MTMRSAMAAYAPAVTVRHVSTNSWAAEELTKQGEALTEGEALEDILVTEELLKTPPEVATVP